MLLEFRTTSRISEFMAHLEQLTGRMNRTSYRPTKPHLWLAGNIPPTSCRNCRETSERKWRTHSFDELFDLLIELAMESETESNMDKYLRKPLRSKTPAERNPGARSSRPNLSYGTVCGGQLKQMQETTLSSVVSNLFFDAWRFHAGFHSVSTLFHSRDGSDKE